MRILNFPGKTVKLMDSVDVYWNTRIVRFSKHQNLSRKDINLIIKVLEWDYGWKINLGYAHTNDTHVTVLYFRFPNHCGAATFEMGDKKIDRLIANNFLRIETLNLENEEIGDDEAKEIASMLTLIIFRLLEKNGINEGLIQKLKEKLEKNRKRELFIIMELIRREKRRKGKWVGVPKGLIKDMINKAL